MSTAPRLFRLKRGTLEFAAALLGVLAFQLYHLYGLHVSKDLPLWDESAYIGWGDRFLLDWRVGSITNSPFYHVLYGAVISGFGLLSSFHAMQYLLKPVLTLLVFLLSYRFSKSASFSLLIGAFFSFSTYHLNIDILVYYGALVPYLAAILVARRAPALSLGLSFLAGLGRLEYMAVPLVHFVLLLVMRLRNGERCAPFPRSTVGGALPAVAVWLFNLFVLTRITVWQFHNRVWFAWSQNYAFFRFTTGRDTGSNPWLDHQFITERDFPNAHSVAEAFVVNPGAVLEHVWFNIRELPGYLAEFAIAHQNAGAWRSAPLFVLAIIVGLGLLGLVLSRPTTSALIGGLRANRLEMVLCLGGIIATAPGLIVSSKTNYIMALVPATLFVLSVAHSLARRLGFYARWSAPVYIVVAAVFASFSFSCPSAYSAKQDKGPVYRDVVAMRKVLEPFKGLRILGVSTASYVNYLGRANGHVFIEPLAISPINQQVTDFSLAALIRSNRPEVLLINSWWQASKSYAAAVEGFSFEDWDAHALNDGVLYTKKGLTLRPAFDARWFEEETLAKTAWRWSSGDAGIALANTIADRPIILRFFLRSVEKRTIEISLNGKLIFASPLAADLRRPVELKIDALPAGENRLEFHTDRPAVRPGNGDSRALTFCIENLETAYGPIHRTQVR